MISNQSYNFSTELNYVEYNLYSIDSKNTETPSPASPVDISPSNSETDVSEARLRLKRIKNKKSSQNTRDKQLAKLIHLRSQRITLMEDLGLSAEDITQKNQKLINLIEKNVLPVDPTKLPVDKKEARAARKIHAAENSRIKRKNEFKALEMQINKFETKLLQNPEERGHNKFVNDILNNLNWE